MVKANYGVDADRAATVVNKIPILHVYGQLGRLPWQGLISGVRTEREYRAVAGWTTALEHAQDITIFSEEQLAEGSFATARAWLLEAKRIYFIGFGYHHVNLERLNPGCGLPAKIVGSAYGVAPRIQRFLSRGDNPFGTGIPLVAQSTDWDASAFLKNCVDL